MPIRSAQPFSAFLNGQQARLQEDAANKRNALADLQLQNEPIEAQQRQKMNALAIQGTEQAQKTALDQSKAKQAFNTIQYAKKSGNPQAFMLKEPGFAENAQKQGVNINDPAAFNEYLNHVESQLGSVIGVAPVMQQQTIKGDDGSILQRDPTTGALKQIVAPQKPDHFTETEAGKNQRASEANALKQRIADAKAAKDAAKAAAGAKTTEGEKSAANYLSRMEKAETLLDSGYVPTPKDFLAANRLMTTESGLMSSLANKWISPEGQKYYQATSDWARAKLRKESGASISPSEIQQEIKTYFPVPGDSDDVIEQKRQARRTATEGMRTMAAGAAAPASGGTLGVGQSTKVGGFTVTRKK